MFVEVRPIDNPKWHGKSGKDSFARPKSIEALYDIDTARYATGLSPDEETKYGKLLNANLDSRFSYEEPHPFYGSSAMRIKLPNNTVLFNTVIPLDYVKVKVLKASRFVANSLKEYEDGVYPDATHVIYDESEEVALKAGKIKQKALAIKIADKMTKSQQADIVMILSELPVRDQSSDYISVEISNLIDENPDEFIKWAKMDNDAVYTRAAVLEALHKNVLTKEGASINFMGDQLGIDLDNTIEYFLNPDNQKIKAQILGKLQNA